MQKKSRANYFLILICSFQILFLASTQSYSYADKKTTDENSSTIVAKVNGDIIYKNQLSSSLKRDKALDKVISEQLLFQASRSISLPDVENRINEKINEMKSRYPSEKRFKSILKSKNIDEKKLRESLRRDIYINEYIKQKVLNDFEVSEKEIKKYYDENKESFRSTEAVRASHILIKVAKDATPDKKEQSRKKIEQVLALLVEGKDFDEIAKKYSEDKTALNGGDLGYVSKGRMPAEFDRIAATLKSGEFSDVVETELGFHIIKIVERRPEMIVPLSDNIKLNIGKYLKEQIAKKKISSHTEELRQKAKIEIYLKSD